MDRIFRPRVSSAGVSPATNDDVMYRTIPSQLKKPSGGNIMQQAASRSGPASNSPESGAWVNKINSMSNQQLDQFAGDVTLPYYRRVFTPTDKRATSSAIQVSPGSAMVNQPREENPLQSQFRSMPAQSGGGFRTLEYNRTTAPTTPPRTLEYRQQDRQNQAQAGGFMPLGGQLPSVASSGAGAGMLGALAQLQDTPREVSSPSQWSADGPVRGAAQPAQNRYVRQQPELVGPPDPIMNFDRSSPVWQRQYEKTFNEAIQADRQRQIDDANKRVDDRLAGRQGYYATPQQRQSGFFARGMGPMAGDAAIMERQNRPLGDGGPAAAAARADQERRRLEAEQAMGGLAKDGLTRYMPNQDLLSFANALRSQEDQQKSEMLQKAGLGGGTSFRDPMQAMTPDEIRFYRHKLNMATNPAYANRVNQQRADRQEMLDNRREMVRARRAGALEAAGASQQMRNLMAGRGALAGQDGFNALMGLAAMQNANQAFNDYGPAYMANMAPQMLDQRLGAEGDLLDKRADLERMRQFDQLRMDIITSGRPEMEKQRALDKLNEQLQNSGIMGNSVFQGRAFGSGYTPPSGMLFPDTSTFDQNAPTVVNFANYMKSLKASPQWNSLSREQQDEFVNRVRSEYFPGMTDSDFAQYRQDNDPDILNNIGNFLLGMFGQTEAQRRRRSENMDALEGSTKPSSDSPWNQSPMTNEDRRILGLMRGTR